MKIDYPHVIENCVGESIVFNSLVEEEGQEKVLLDAYLEPGSGPTMHTHFKQDEQLTVVSGELTYQTQGNEPIAIRKGETVLFKRGTPHKFWNSGNEKLHCTGWVYPVNSVVFFLSALYEAQNKAGGHQPETFSGAYLLTRYASEYDMPEVPSFVKKVVMPATYGIGKLLGKYGQYRNAPEPIRPS